MDGDDVDALGIDGPLDEHVHLPDAVHANRVVRLRRHLCLLFLFPQDPEARCLEGACLDFFRFLFLEFWCLLPSVDGSLSWICYFISMDTIYIFLVCLFVCLFVCFCRFEACLVCISFVFRRCLLVCFPTSHNLMTRNKKIRSINSINSINLILSKKINIM